MRAFNQRRFFLNWLSVSIIFAVTVLTACRGNYVVSTSPVFITSYAENLSTDWQINYVSHKDETSMVVNYDTVSRLRDDNAYTYKVGGTYQKLKGTSLIVHHFPLKDLRPNTLYYFTVSNHKKFLTTELRFKTPPAQGPFRFVNGGDMFPSTEMAQLTSIAAKYNPHFIVIGGDIAYDGGDPKFFDRWVKLFENYATRAINSEGAIIPLVLAIGNHEVNEEKKAPYFDNLFAQTPNKESYFKRFLGDTLFIFLDSGNKVSHESQVNWLSDMTKSASEFQRKIAVYHHGLYPSYRKFDSRAAVAGRTYWLPYFDNMNLDIALEHHDHTFKRTHFLKNNQIVNPGEGTLYLGDGNWGNHKRKPDLSHWYLQKANSDFHFWLLEVGIEEIKATAINDNAKIIDEIIVSRK